jgi:glycosyltransferase involved in cell wall biosynthesis
VLVTHGGTPCGYLHLPGPGTTSDEGLLDAAVVRHADAFAARERFVEAFRRRLGALPRQAKRHSCSVVICTHRRPDYIPDVLEALRRLDPPADEIVVVDNAPGDRDCRRQAEQAGARYVREDRQGLDNARNAGLRAARSDLVAFVDDDCVPVEGWLRNLPELFDDPIVAAVTGPAFAHALETPAQVRFEDQGGHIRGLQRLYFDWRVLDPIAATRAGAGLNMVFRRSLLEPLGELFPPELDAGTPTESGGDMYALYKVLRAGYRVVYDPATYVFHQHRPDPAALHKTIRGYGVGVCAVLTKLLVEERELAGPKVWYWLWWLYMDAVRRRLAGRADAVDVRIGWDYLLGGLVGGPLWWRSRKRFGREERAPSSDDVSARPTGARPTPAPGAVAVSVVVSAAVPGSEARCLEALAQQEAPGAELEVIVAGPQDAPKGTWNEGAGRARGELLLFLDAEAVPEPGLVASHLARHRAGGRDRLVVGRSVLRPARATLTALHESLRCHDHFEAKRTAVALTFADVVASNVSLPRTTFGRLGGLDAELEQAGRGAWELGVRALQSGVEVCYEPEAVAVRAATPSARAAIEEARRDGRGDALLAARHPVVAPSLPAPPALPGIRPHPVAALRFRAVQRLGAGPVALILNVLEWLRLRTTWLRLFGLARRAAYQRGACEAGIGLRGDAPAPQPLRIELGSDEPIPPPAVAPPLVELTLDGTSVGWLRPLGGQWPGSLADQAVAAVAGRLHELPGARPRAFEESPEGRDLTGTAVIFGPARHPADDRHRAALEAAGASVEVLDGDPARHWAALDGAIRASEAELVALPLPGVAAAPGWLASARLAVTGDRVAAAVGGALPPGTPSQPLLLTSRALLCGRYPLPGSETLYLLVRRPLYEALGGFDLTTVRLGTCAPVLDLLERAVDAGYVVGQRDTPGLEPHARPARRAEWQRHRSRGGLMLRRARRAGWPSGWPWFVWRGLLPLAADLYRSLRARDRSPRSALRRAAAFLSGCLAAAVEPTRAPEGGSAPEVRFPRTHPAGGAPSASATGPPGPPAR